MAVEQDGDSPVRLRLDEQLCFALYAATNAITRAYRPLLAEIGLTYPQYLVMLALWQDGPQSVGRIASRLQLESHAITPLVRRLESAGLVGRTSTTDRRVVQVVATPAGRRLEAAAARVQARVACATGLSPDHLDELRGELCTVTARLVPIPATGSHQANRPRLLKGEAS